MARDVRPDAANDAFLREVDDEYRRAQLEGYWQRYGRLLAIGVVLLLVVLAGVLYWREDRARRAGATGEAFNLALTRAEAGNAAAAAPVLADLGRTGAPGYRAAARLEQAAVALQANDTAKAVTLYRGIAGDATLPQPFRDAATIRGLRVEYDTLPPATIVDRLKPYAVPGGPWFAVAAEMTGLAEIRLGQRDRALPLFVAIVRDTTAPASLRNRAAQMAVDLGAEPATLLGPQTSGIAQ
ncbi:MAG: tetratricopeptide repeat protein [Sphingomonadaceae bacterium]|nr:tetratricopeptide repeat protein [Sphingomonadaceae bacterium]